MAVKVGIINVTGYAGAELARLLYLHPEAQVTVVTGRSDVGKKLADVFPHLALYDLTIELELAIELVEGPRVIPLCDLHHLVEGAA